MDMNATLRVVQEWPVEEQLEFLFRAWDTLLDSGHVPDTDADFLDEIDRRLAAHDANPNDVVTWEQIVARVKRQR